MVDGQLNKTVENFDIESPEQRTRILGLPDIWRKYGPDFKERLAQAGFVVKVEKYAGEIEPSLARKYGLKVDDEIYFCTKPM